MNGRPLHPQHASRVDYALILPAGIITKHAGDPADDEDVSCHGHSAFWLGATTTHAGAADEQCLRVVACHLSDLRPDDHGPNALADRVLRALGHDHAKVSATGSGWRGMVALMRVDYAGRQLPLKAADLVVFETHRQNHHAALNPGVTL